MGSEKKNDRNDRENSAEKTQIMDLLGPLEDHSEQQQEEQDSEQRQEEEQQDEEMVDQEMSQVITERDELEHKRESSEARSKKVRESRSRSSVPREAATNASSSQGPPPRKTARQTARKSTTTSTGAKKGATLRTASTAVGKPMPRKTPARNAGKVGSAKNKNNNNNNNKKKKKKKNDAASTTFATSALTYQKYKKLAETVGNVHNLARALVDKENKTLDFMTGRIVEACMELVKVSGTKTIQPSHFRRAKSIVLDKYDRGVYSATLMEL